MPSFLDPNEILKELGLKEDMTAADFGCGSGSWVIPLAKILAKGSVLGVDVQEDALSALESRARTFKLKNVQKVLANLETGAPGIKNNSCDLVLMTNLLFQLEDKKIVFKEAGRVLKPQGRILVVEWKQGAVMGPKTQVPSRDEVRQLGKESGFLIEKEFEAGDYHYALIFIKA